MNSSHDLDYKLITSTVDCGRLFV